MNVKRFTGRTSREAMQKVRQCFGDDAVVLSTKPCAEGVEMLAMAHGSVESIERMAHGGERTPPVFAAPDESRDRAATEASVQDDVKRLAMSTLSFQDYVRERLLKRRQAALKGQNVQGEREHIEPSFQPEGAAPRAMPAAVSARPEVPQQALAQRLAERQHTFAQAAQAAEAALQAPATSASTSAAALTRSATLAQRMDAAASLSLGDEPTVQRPAARPVSSAKAQPAAQMSSASTPGAASAPAARREPPVLREELGGGTPVLADAQSAAASAEMMDELRAMKGLIEERFGAIAFMEKLQRSPSQAHLAQKLLDGGFSPALIRKLLDGMPTDVIAGAANESDWAATVLERNLLTGERDAAIEDQGGVFALVGSTGVGKTTTTAKLAAAFATKHGASNLGLITLDAYRIGAHEQLRAYGRILGVPVHTAHDRAALEDLLDLLSAKKLVLIDTAGMAQRDSRTRELLDMLAHPSIRRLLVVNAAAQGETIEDVLVSYRAASASGVVLSKLDEAVKLGPALDAVIRHRLKVVGVANGQRVPEDWHRLSAQALVHRALRGGGSPAYRLDASEVNLVFSTSSTSTLPTPPLSASNRSAGLPTH